MGWKCFLTEPSNYCNRSLRRYSGKLKCPGPMGYHDEDVIIDYEIPAYEVEEGGFLKREYDGDPRWPKKCACGYEFALDDEWQVNVRRLYKGSPDGSLYILRELPVGAMWDAHWLKDATPDRYTGPDGKAWCVMMPCRIEFIVYGPSDKGQKWQVTGTPPLISVRPSIGIGGKYHGFIGSSGVPPGVISEDVDGRKFPGIPRTA